MKSNKKSYFILLPIVVLIAFLLSLIEFRPIPEGIPNDYYDRIDVLEEYDIRMHVYSDTIDFNGDYEFIPVNHLSDIDLRLNTRMNVLVLDMEKYVQSEFATEEQIRNLYETNGVTIIIVNYFSSNSTQFEDFIDFADVESDMITFGYGENHISEIGSMSGTFPSNQMLMYAILHNIANTLNEQFS